jgi:glycosyltransferase involved in cell wall biosynthesis
MPNKHIVKTGIFLMTTILIIIKTPIVDDAKFAGENMPEIGTITVLICVHSKDDLHDSLLQRALESLVSQSYTNFNVIIILDGSWEFTQAIICKYKDVLDIRFFERPYKQGLAAAKNFGLSKIKTDWVAYLDADDAWTEDKLEKQVQFALENPEYDVIGTQAWDVYNPGEENEEITENCFSIGQYETHEQIKARLPYENCICHGSVLIRRRCIGNYDTSKNAIGMEDFFQWHKMMNDGCRFYNIPKRLYLYSMNTGVAR